MHDEYVRDLFCTVFCVEYELARENHLPCNATHEAIYAANRAVEAYNSQFRD